MFTERQAIQDELHDNRRLMMEIRSKNMDLIKRLREIDERDMKDKVSYDGLNTITSNMTDILGKLADLIPSIPPEAVINQLVNKQDQIDVHIEEPKETKIEEPTNIEQLANQAKIESSKRVEPMSKERVASVIKEIVMEFGEIKTNRLEEEFVKRTGKKYANFSEQIRNSREIYPSIEKAGFGKYKMTKENKGVFLNTFPIEKKMERKPVHS